MSRLGQAWRALAGEQRLAALAALGLFVSMFLPWYGKTDTLVVHGAAKATQTSLSAFQAFSFVEAAVLLVSAGVLVMLFARAEGRTFQLPGGDGAIVTLAGGWTSLLIFYRLLDKPGLSGNARITATVGVEWGIFIALLLAIGLTYAGARLRALERPGPPLRRPRGVRPRRPLDADASARPHRSERPAPRHDRAAAPRPFDVDAPGGHGPRPDRRGPVPGERASPWEERTGARDERPRDDAPFDADATVITTRRVRPPRAAPVPAPPTAPERAPGASERAAAERAGGAPERTAPARRRPRYPPAPPGASGQLSFEDSARAD